MENTESFEILLVTLPGLEDVLQAEARALGFKGAKALPGGVTVTGGWPEVWKANLWCRTASKVLVRIGEFRVFHLAQLDKRARRIPWADILRPDIPVKVEVTTKASRVYHAGAAKERIARAIEETVGAPVTAEAEVCIKARIHKDVCTFSLDSSGEGLHKRGHKQAVNKAPMRETMAAALLRLCGYGPGQSLYDPMCGSGTFPIEAAEWAAGLAPGRDRSFAFEALACFDADGWNAVRAEALHKGQEGLLRARSLLSDKKTLLMGSDRDAGAVAMSQDNAARAGVGEFLSFAEASVSLAAPPDGDFAPGLVFVNPPYGSRLGDKKALIPLYRALGERLKDRFSGWRVGLVTSEASLAHATGLTWANTSPPLPHGGLKIKLYQTNVLG